MVTKTVCVSPAFTSACIAFRALRGRRNVFWVYDLFLDAGGKRLIGLYLYRIGIFVRIVYRGTFVEIFFVKKSVIVENFCAVLIIGRLCDICVCF